MDNTHIYSIIRETILAFFKVICPSADLSELRKDDGI